MHKNIATLLAMCTPVFMPVVRKKCAQPNLTHSQGSFAIKGLSILKLVLIIADLCKNR